MSREQDEGTIQVTIDDVEFTPNVVFGLTWGEFGGAYGFFFVLSLFISIPMSIWLLGKFWYGIILSLALAGGGAALFARKATALKNGRPSYLLWYQWRRSLQNAGYFSFGLVKDTVWENKASRKNEK